MYILKKFYSLNPEIDTEPAETKNGLNFLSVNPVLTSRIREALAYVPTFRKFELAPSYLLFGCILLENLIEHENVTIYQKIVTEMGNLEEHPNLT